MQPIKSGISRPPIIMIFSEHKVGKSTYGSTCPKPFFIDIEGGLQGLEVNCTPQVSSIEEFFSWMDYLDQTKDLPYRTIVIDSVDWLERLIFNRVCAQNKVTDIGQIPYGRGQVAAEAVWTQIVERLTTLNRGKKLMIVLLSHAIIQRFESPDTESFDRYVPDLHKRASSLLCEFVDILGFAALKTSTVTKDKGFGASITKAKTTGERVLYLEQRGGFSAGNRYGLPASLPFEWSAVAEELKKKGKASKGNLTGVNEAKEEMKIKNLENKENKEQTLGAN